MNCGKVVCELEGEGPCLFCGTWVDREIGYDWSELCEVGDSHEFDREDDPRVLADKYEEALRHRNKLIDFDINAAKRLGVIDENADWY